MVLGQIRKSYGKCPARNTKDEKNLARRFNFKDIKVPVKTRDIHKIEKKNSISISVFGYDLCIKNM